MKLIPRIFERQRRRWLLQVMRGFGRSSLEERRRADETCELLALAPIPKFCASRRIFGASHASAELAVRQYLYTRIGFALAPQLLVPKPVVQAMPRHWREILRNSGYAVDEARSAALWAAFQVGMLAQGVAIGGKTFCTVVGRSFSNRPVEPFAHFEGLAPANLPSAEISYEIVSWYRRWNASVHLATHRVPAPSGSGTSRLDFPPISGFKARAVPRLLVNMVAATAAAAADVLRSRWWSAVLLGEAMKSWAVHQSPPTAMAQDYLFNNSGWIYRPLWTYEAAAAGSRILFYHYSTNSERFRRETGYTDPFTWKLTNWPHHLVWDEWQADFVRRTAAAPVTIDVVGPISFSDSDEAIPSIKQNAVAVFDVQPFRMAKYRLLGLETDYFAPEVSTAFLRDLAIATEAAGRQMAWKRKRIVGKAAHPKYRRLADTLGSLPHIVSVPASIAAERLVASSAAVVSMPFTSTALIGRQLNKPTCYYDPTGKIHPDDRAAHGIQVIRGVDDLTEWLKAN